MTKTSPSAMTRHPCQTGSGRPLPVAFLCVSDFDAIDSDRQAVSADRLSGKRQHAFEHGNADRQVAIEIKEGSE